MGYSRTRENLLQCSKETNIGEPQRSMYSSGGKVSDHKNSIMNSCFTPFAMTKDSKIASSGREKSMTGLATAFLPPLLFLPSEELGWFSLMTSATISWSGPRRRKKRHVPVRPEGWHFESLWRTQLLLSDVDEGHHGLQMTKRTHMTRCERRAKAEQVLSF